MKFSEVWKMKTCEIRRWISWSTLSLFLQVVFFTNQMGIAKGKLRPEVFKSKVEDILTKLQLPVQVCPPVVGGLSSPS